MTDSKQSRLTADDALDRIRAAADASTPPSPDASVPDLVMEKAWQVAQSYRQWAARNASLGVVLSRSQPANDWSWSDITLGGMAAETPKEAFSAMRRVPSKETAERWSLSRYPVNGQKAVYLMFEAETDSIERYTGCRIQVLAEDKIYELGEVNEDGVAELRLEGTVDISQALVRIGIRKHGR